MAGGRRWVVVGAAAAALLAAAGYAVADSYDLLPGRLTTQAAPEPPAAPSAPGASRPDDAAAAAGLLTPLVVDAPTPDPVALAAVVAPLLADPRLGSAVSASVADALTGQVLLDVGADAPREPASVAKVLTAAAALHRLGPDHVLRTSAVQGVAPAEVVLLAAGDVLLAAGAGDPASARGHAGLGDLADATAAELVARGRTSVTVHVDDSLFSGPPLGPGVTQSDVDAGYVAPVTAIAVDAGRTGPDPYAPRVADPALTAATTFAGLLRARGVSVVGPSVRAIAPPGAQVLASVTSAPLAEVVAYLLAGSDNTVAESLARLVAVDAGRATGFADAGRAVLDQLSLLGIPPGAAVLADGSGLSDGSSVPASLLTAVLATAASPQHGELRSVLTGLPVAALNGTLVDRFHGDPGAAGLVRAKTGSLAGVTSLAGTAQTVDGRLLTFALLADATGPTEPARAAADTFASALVACGCR